MNRAAAARPSGVDAEPEPWERVAFEAAVHSDPIELVGAKRALKAFFFRLLPDIKVEDSFGEADQGPTPLSWASPGPLRRMDQRGSNGCHQVGATH